MHVIVPFFTSRKSPSPEGKGDCGARAGLGLFELLDYPFRRDGHGYDYREPGAIEIVIGGGGSIEVIINSKAYEIHEAERQ